MSNFRYQRRNWTLYIIMLLIPNIISIIADNKQQNEEKKTNIIPKISENNTAGW